MNESLERKMVNRIEFAKLACFCWYCNIARNERKINNGVCLCFNDVNVGMVDEISVHTERSKKGSATYKTQTVVDCAGSPR